MKAISVFLLAAFAASATAAAADERQGASEISLNLELDSREYVSGERIRGVLGVVNASTETLHGNGTGAPDRLFLEAKRESDKSDLSRISSAPFTVRFAIDPSRRQDFEIFAERHFDFMRETRYLVRPVLVHGKTRYEGAWRSFSVVPGMKLAESVQLFSNVEGLRRDLTLVYWGRNRLEHLFLKIRDTSPEGPFIHPTIDLGPIMRVTAPKISISPSGEATILWRTNQDYFARAVYWSLPKVFEHHKTESLVDPDIAGSTALRDRYKSDEPLKPAKQSWWRFW